MALKDWKKDKMKHGWNYSWSRNNPEDLIVIGKNNILNRWKVVTLGEKIVKLFKTKSQALKFAKSYMRTH